MSTRTSNKVGKLAKTPGTAVTPAGKGVTGPATATPVAGAGVQGPAASILDVAAAVEAYITALGTFTDALTPHLRRPPADGSLRIGTARGDHVAAAPVIADLLRNHPELAPDVSPDAIRAGVTVLTETRRLEVTLKELTGQVKDTGRMAFDDAWRQASGVYAQAQLRARTDKTMVDAIVPVRDALALGARTATAARTADAARRKADAAQQRAAVAQQRALAANQRHARTLQAHAIRHPVVGTPVPAAVSQGPAVTTPADAASNQGPAVNPQGPAPGR